jgi:hypothetical protein
MVVQPPLVWNSKDITILSFVGLVLPPQEYTTVITNFPGTNCCEPFGLTGVFFLDFTFYDRGKKVAWIQTNHTDEKGYLQVQFDELFSIIGRDFDGIVITDFYHSRAVPVELYLSHVLT